MNTLLLVATLVFIVVIIIALALSRRTSVQKPWSDNIERLTEANREWRNVIHTTDNMQIVTMSVPVGQNLGAETHSDNDQFFRIESGEGLLELGSNGDTKFSLHSGSAAIVPKGTKHNIVNTGTAPLQLYTIYAPPHHPPGTVDKTHADEILRHS
jgi:mannose-6-phosphate isomerase-like protein (cupin superfamily)